jgi:hypothetical protein
MAAKWLPVLWSTTNEKVKHHIEVVHVIFRGMFENGMLSALRRAMVLVTNVTTVYCRRYLA